MVTVAPYGSWDSPITPDTFAKGNCKAICELQATEAGVFWVEQSASTGKRELFFRDSELKDAVRWAPEQSVQNCVHEYGGGSFVPTPEGGVVYTTVEGLYEQSANQAAPLQLADSNEKTFRFADFSVTASHVFAVYETHQKKGEDPENRIVSVDRKTKDQKVIASGADFYAAPRVSPDGKKIVWMQWNHVNMPWDETSIHIADLNADGSASNEKVVKSGVGKNINYYCPSWSPDGRLLMVNDSTNYWNVYRVDTSSDGYPETNIYPVQREIGYPLWQFSDRPYATNGNGDVVMVVSDGRLKLRRGDSVRSLSTDGFSVFSHLAISQQGLVYCIASGPSKPSTLLRIDTTGEKDTICAVREARDAEDLSRFDISEPETVEFKSDGVTVTGFYYAPKSSTFSAPAGTLPPCLLLGHGGPTAPAQPNLDLKKQFFTSRGFAVFDVNYRGSTGFGSDFRHALKRQWGIVDRNDMINGAKALIERGIVDGEKVCIMGSSAGGYLLLSALIHSDVFKAAVSHYGVADLLGLAKDTHKFERGYNEVLIGKYPEEESIYQERSPINHISRLSTPIAFLHGKDDTVVPVAQSVEMYEKLKEKGITTALMLFEGEGHGFRGPDAVKSSTEASYYFLCKAMGIAPSVQSNIEIVNAK